MTNTVEVDPTGRRLSTPRAAAVAGLLFGLLFSASLVLLRSTIPANPFSGSEWIEQGARRIIFALELMPFAGIAFLWFIGVLRDLLGAYEDRLFSTVFFGSGILFLAMVFVSMAIAGGLIAGSQLNPQIKFDNQVVYFSRSFMFQLVNVYAIRMAGVFMISLGTIWLRTRLIPRWLTILTYLLALGLLLIISLNLWVALIFPAWVGVVSIEILRLNLKRTTPKDPSPDRAASPPGSTDPTN